jgi:NAD(P)-dependent dehydrogenase (short-subunit alcohol dehydrogenase family)
VIDTALEGKTVLVTGAAGGIGRALAEAFAAEGANLLLTANAGYDALRDWLAEQPWSGRALAARADVTRPAELSRAAAEGVSASGDSTPASSTPGSGRPTTCGWTSCRKSACARRSTSTCSARSGPCAPSSEP